MLISLTVFFIGDVDIVAGFYFFFISLEESLSIFCDDWLPCYRNLRPDLFMLCLMINRTSIFTELFYSLVHWISQLLVLVVMCLLLLCLFFLGYFYFYYFLKLRFARPPVFMFFLSNVKKYTRVFNCYKESTKRKWNHIFERKQATYYNLIINSWL